MNGANIPSIPLKMSAPQLRRALFRQSFTRTVCGDLVVMPEQYRLDKAGEKFHIEVEEIYRKGDGEEPGSAAEDRKRYLFAFMLKLLSFSLPCVLVREHLDRRIERLLAHHGAHIDVELVADGLARVHAGIAEVVADPDEVQPALSAPAPQTGRAYR